MDLLLEMFAAFFKIGAFTFGGGYAMIPLIQKEVVDTKEWVTCDEFIDILALSQTAPGPIAVNTSVFVGYKTAGLPGAVAALLGTVLPSFFVILAIAIFFAQFRGSTVVDAAFSGVRPAVVALIASAAYRIGKTALKNRRCVAMAALGFIAVAILDVHPIAVIVGSGTLGYFLFRQDFGVTDDADREVGRE